MSIVWRNEMSVGNTAIDNDHKYLIAMINALEAAINSKLRDKVLLLHVSQLTIYTAEHFAREEAVQENIKFAQSEEHKEDHKKFFNQIKAVQEKIESSKQREEHLKSINPIIKNTQQTTESSKLHDTLDLVAQELSDLLKDWLLKHILKEDMKMKPYFKI